MKFIAQHDQADCGLACLRMITNHYGRDYSGYYFRKIAYLTRQGVSILTLGQAAETIGFKTIIGELSLKYLQEKAQLPCILYWDQGHFVVLYKISVRKRGKNVSRVYHIADPGVGKVRLKEEEFVKYWPGEKAKGYGLFMEPTQEFYTFKPDEEQPDKHSVKKAAGFLRVYFARFKKNYVQVMIAMLVTAFVALMVPYLTQSIVDVGIRQKDTGFVALIIFFQIGLFLSGTFTEVIRSHLLMHISSRINISVMSDFLRKLMRLPVSFFESKMAGDIMQRLNDHGRIETFINSSLLTMLFSIVNLVIFLFVLSSYSIFILGVFLVGSTLSVLWTLLFMRWRKSLDYKRFRELANSNDKLFEMINGMPEIKLNAFERYKQAEWQEVQVRLFKVNLSNLKLDQYQRIGATFFDQLKNVAITFIAASLVINDQMTLGMMLAISYVLGQLNAPIRQMAEFINTAQLTKIAIERMNEVYMEKDEEKSSHIQPQEVLLKRQQKNTGLFLENVSFQYEGPESDFVLKDVNAHIPEGKVTAIVGSSGSGKTTLLKLLLNFYAPVSGHIYLNGTDLQACSPAWWRKECGTVMQEGFIFSDTIRRNIVMGDESDDPERLIQAVEIANIGDYIADLPLHFDTRIGASGIGLSTGQKQRIMIARAVYKNPRFLFFDEATSALDARNERVIMNNLDNIFTGKTVVIVAHRLSTVKHADQIIVLEKGEIVETGTHQELVSKEGFYFNLVRNQLELGV